MIVMVKEMYERVFNAGENVYGKGEPEPVVQKFAELVPNGCVLELGAGQGRNALFLGRKGFEVTALELSDAGEKQIGDVARTEHLPVTVMQGDVREGITGQYEAIVSTYMLHHLAREEVGVLIGRMKEHTEPGGVNVLAVFSNNSDFFKEDPASGNFYPDREEMRRLYADWEIVECSEAVAGGTLADGARVSNGTISLIVRRPMSR